MLKFEGLWVVRISLYSIELIECIYSPPNVVVLVVVGIDPYHDEYDTCDWHEYAVENDVDIHL